jgi:hypothetical protein
MRLPKLVVLSTSLNPSCTFRCQYCVLRALFKLTNVLGDYVQVGFWSILEINIAIICACMPNLRVFLLRIFPKVLGTSRDKSSKYMYSRDREFDRSGESGNHRNIHNGNGILTSKSYAVNYNDEQVERENSQVNLVKLRPDGGNVSTTINGAGNGKDHAEPGRGTWS